MNKEIPKAIQAKAESEWNAFSKKLQNRIDFLNEEREVLVTAIRDSH
jgi:hypothetical protein